MDLASVLSLHRPADEDEARSLRLILDFATRHADPFDRRIPEGHLTGSAFVVSRAGGHVLLLHHRTLQRWLQPGGHADAGESAGEQVALREAREETGLPDLDLHPGAPRPLDVDVHEIPARGREPAHLHLDLRYLAVADSSAPFRPAAGESSALRWLAWDQLGGLDLDAGLRRGLAKARTWAAAGAGGLRPSAP